MTARDTDAVADADAVADDVGRASVATLGGGHPLERAHRRRLETLLAADLGDVRIHRGPHSNAAADSLHADAYTVGEDIHFAADAYHPDTAAGFALLAHEVLHTRQHHPGPRVDDRPWAIASADDPHERAARIFADQTSRGAGYVRRPEATASRSRRMIYRHDSFEHRALGDVATADIAVISGGGATRTELVEREIALQQLWQQDPESVTEEQLSQLCPQLRSLRLQASGLLVTYGELNALPDYIATGQVADTVSKAVLLPILQFIRQESFNRFNGLLGRTSTTAFQALGL